MIIDFNISHRSAPPQWIATAATSIGPGLVANLLGDAIGEEVNWFSVLFSSSSCTGSHIPDSLRAHGDT